MELPMKKILVAFISLLCFPENLEGTPKVKEKTVEVGKTSEVVKVVKVVKVATNSFLENLKKTNFPSKCKLREIVIGNEKAPNTVIICSSFTCSHCRDFHQTILPDFIKKYVNTGKAKVKMMFYVDDIGAMEAATLVRCLGGDSNDIILDLQDKIYHGQKEWMSSEKPQEKLRSMFKDFGYDEKKVKGCLANKKIQAGVMIDQKTMMHELKIQVIPAFVVNGKLHHGKLSADEIAAMFKDQPSKK
jgi:protein-disulfide isomerase